MTGPTGGPIAAIYENHRTKMMLELGIELG